MTKVFLVKRIEQIDNHQFQIIWNDGIVGTYRLSDLQKKCPCANCTDEWTGQRIVPESSVRDDVRAVKVQSVGRYALKIQFTSGCSTGIYGFDMLHQIASEQQNAVCR